MGNYDGSIKIDSNINSKGFNEGINTMTNAVRKLGKVVIAAFSIKAITSFVKASVDAASELSNSFTGLKSILDGQGKSFSQAKNFIEEYISDGLVSATEATTAYKNLAARGYNTDQIQKVMTALKDSATFGRQASYTLGEAVQSASEGLKNENSILVDNAGVTKNVAKMWEDYAKSVGKSTSALTQQEKIQAEVNGILEETKFQTGDSEIYLNTYSGQLARLNASFTTLKQTVGNIFIPIFQAILPYINAVIQGLTKVAKVFATVVQLIFGKTANTSKELASNSSDAATEVSNLGSAAEKAGKQAKGALASFDDLNVLAQDTSSGSSGSSGSSTIDIPEIVADDSDGTSAIESVSENILKYIEPLQQISLDNLTKSFQKLKDSISGLGKTIWSGLEWAYFNLLVPLSKWTIEDLLPAFFNVLSGALNLLNQAITDIQPIFQWLWDNALKPIAEWTGGVIVDTLNSIGNALQLISQNEIAMAILEGLAIAIGLVAGAIAVYNAAMVICNIVTGIFSGIMAVLTSPITLVVLVIGALIAIILLLVKHWDEVSAALSAGWEWIKNKAEEIFTAIGNFLTEIWNGIKEVVINVWNSIKNSVETAINIVSGIISAVLNAIKSLWDTIWNWLKNLVVSIWNNISTTISNVFNGIKNTISNILNSIKSVWNNIWNGLKTTVTNIFNGIWGTIKGVINSILGGIEGMANGVINGINKVTSAINNLSFDIPDWVPGLGGKKFGFNIKQLNTISLPRLATGAVIPPNQEFLAVLGDQKSGRNLEAPEDLIRQIVREEINNNNQPIIINATFELEGTTIGRKIIEVINKEQEAAGKTLLKI